MHGVWEHERVLVDEQDKQEYNGRTIDMSDSSSTITAQDIDAMRENLEHTIAAVQELLALLRGINDSAV